MLGNERDIFAIIIRSYFGTAIFLSFCNYIISKGGIGISVTGIQTKFFSHAGTKRCFCTITTAFSRIDGNTSQTAFCKLRELLVAGVHIKCCKISPKPTFPQRKMTAHFVVPRIFGFVSSRRFHINLFGRYHLVHHFYDGCPPCGILPYCRTFFNGIHHRVGQFCL